MSLSELLNSEVDLAAWAGLARRGVSWWLEELSGMLPAGLRERLSSRPSTWIEPTEHGWRAWTDGRPREAGAVRGERRVVLLAPPGAVLVREIAAPRLSPRDLRRMAALEIETLSPLAPDLIHFDVQVLETPDGTRRVLLGVIERKDAAELLASARAAGYAPSALSIRDGGSSQAPLFDFLPAVLDAQGASSVDRVRLWAWVGVGILLGLDLAGLVARDVVQTSRLRALVEGQGATVQVVQRLRARVAGEDARRRDLIARGRRADPVRVADALSAALPTGAFVRRLDFNGRNLRLTGFVREGVDPVRAVQAAGFVDVRVQIGPAPTPDSPYRPFDLTADARGPA